MDKLFHNTTTNLIIYDTHSCANLTCTVKVVKCNRHSNVHFHKFVHVTINSMHISEYKRNEHKTNCEIKFLPHFCTLFVLADINIQYPQLADYWLSSFIKIHNRYLFISYAFNNKTLYSCKHSANCTNTYVLMLCLCWYLDI